MAEVHSFPLVRADDNLSLHVKVTGLTPTLTPGGWVLTSPTTDHATIAVDFPSQHIVEYADDEDELAPFQAKPIYAPPTRVVFDVAPSSTAIPLSVEGILDAIANCQLVAGPDAPVVEFLAPPEAAAPATVAARRSAGDTGADVATVRRRRAEAQVRNEVALVRVTSASPEAPARPKARAAAEAEVATSSASAAVPVTTTATSVSMPARLELAIGGGATRFTHAARPVEHDGLVEQWHSRFTVATLGTGVRQEVRTPAVVRSSVPKPASSNQEWMKVVAEDTVNNALTSGVAAKIRAAAQLPQPAGPITSVTAGSVDTPPFDPFDPDDPQDPLPTPHDSRRPLGLDGLTLSPLGGSLRLAGRWGSSQPISNYRHAVVHGRDDEVRTDTEGNLYPFGHRARLSTVTTRAPRQPADSSPVTLRTTSVLTVLQPVVKYPNDAAARSLPWRRIEITTLVSPQGDFVPRVAGSTDGFLTVGGQPHRLECRAVDHADHVASFSLPMYFVSSGTPIATAAAAWKARGTAFTEIELHGQPVGVAPVNPGASAAAAAGAGAGAGAPTAADATTLLTSLVRLPVDPPVPTFRAAAREFVGRSPALGAVGADAERTFTYAKQYLTAGFASANAGELLLTMEASLVDMGRDAVGLVTAPQLPMRGISRLVGAVSATGDDPAESLAKVALNEFDPEAYLGNLPATLFGIFPLKDLLAERKNAEGPLDLAANAPKQFVETLDGLRTVTVSWSTDLVAAGQTFVPTGDDFPDFLQLIADPGPIKLNLNSSTSVGTNGTVSTRTTCEILDAKIALGIKSDRLVTLPIKRVSFESTDSAAPKVDVDLGSVKFEGPLSFVRTLADLIAQSGLGAARVPDALPWDTSPALASDAPANGPYVTLIEGGVEAGLALAVPDLAIGMFSLQDLNFSSRFDLFFDGRAPLLSLDFSTPENPFGLSVSAIAGGGYLGIVLSTKGIVGIKGSLEFGAAVAIDIGIAAGRASVMGGLYFEILDTGASLTGYLRMEGHLEVLKLITTSVVMALYMTYESDGKVRGEAVVAFTIKMLFFRKTVSTTVKRQFVGSNSDPTFAELMAPADWPADEPLPWHTYCRSFAAAAA